MQRTPKIKRILAVIVLSLVLVFGVGAPVGPSGIQKIHAQAFDIGNLVGSGLGGIGTDLVQGLIGNLLGTGGGGLGGILGGAQPVQIVSDFSPTSIARTASDFSQTLIQTAEKLRDEVLNPLFWNLSNATIGNMIGTLMDWVNDTGNGEPAFITNLEAEEQEAQDAQMVELRNSPVFNAMCESMAPDIQAAIEENNALNRRTSEAAATARYQCEMDETSPDEDALRNQGDFTRGGWDAFFAAAVEGNGDPINIANAIKAELAEEQQEAVNRERVEYIAGGGYRNIQRCGSIDPDTGIELDCETTTPGSTVQAEVSNKLNIPNLRVAFADSFDEMVGGVFSQFANQALMGIDGLLGLSTDARFGDGGDLSFIDALLEEGSNRIAGADPTGRIMNAISREMGYINTLVQTVQIIDDVTDTINNARDEYGTCFTVELPQRLSTMRDNSSDRATEAGVRADELLNMYDQINAATTDAERAEFAVAIGTYESQTGAQLEATTQNAEDRLNNVLPGLIDDLETQIDLNIESCSAGTGV